MRMEALLVLALASSCLSRSDHCWGYQIKGPYLFIDVDQEGNLYVVDGIFRSLSFFRLTLIFRRFCHEDLPSWGLPVVILS
jgi:hypothetical protein